MVKSATRTLRVLEFFADRLKVALREKANPADEKIQIVRRKAV